MHHREIVLKNNAASLLGSEELQNKLRELLPLSKVTLIIDRLFLPQLVSQIQELMPPETTLFSDVAPEAQRWCDHHSLPFSVALADLQHETRLYPFQWLNLLQLLKCENLVVVTNELFAPHLLKLLGSETRVLELPFFSAFKEEVFLECDNKISQALQLIKAEPDGDIAIYCDTLHQIDQIYQALYFHGEQSTHLFELHLVLPAEQYYLKYVQQLLTLAYPKFGAPRQIFIAINSIDLQRYLQNLRHKIQLIIQLGYDRMIKKFYDEVQAIVFRNSSLSKADVIIRNRVAYFPKVVYLFKLSEFLELSPGELMNEEELEYNHECLYARACALKLESHIKHSCETVPDDFYYKAQIPYVYHEPLLEAENQTFNYYTHMISTLLTYGEILSEGNLESKKNPFRSFSQNQNREYLIRSNHYWSKMGDITSWIQLINKFIIFIEDQISIDDQLQLEDTEATHLLKKKSQNELIKWCRTQNINMPKMILILSFNEYIHDITETYRSEYSILNKLGSIMNLKRTVSLKKQQSMPEHSEEIQVYILRQFYKGLCAFSGHRSVGYYNYESGKSYKLCHNNLMAIIGDFPLTCIVVAFNENKSGSLEVKYSCKVDDLIIPQVAPQHFVRKHKLTVIKRQSLHLSELTINNVSQVLFNELWKNQEGPKLSQPCILHPNMDLGLIQILYDPTQADPQIIQSEIQAMIEALKVQFQNQVRELPYHENSKFIMEAGGKMRMWIEKDSYLTFFISGLPLTTTQEELEELLDQSGIAIDEIKLQKEDKTNKILARITLQYHEDVEWCVSNLNQFKGEQIKAYSQHDQFEQVERKLGFEELFYAEITWGIHLNRGQAKVSTREPMQSLTICNQSYPLVWQSENTYKISQLDPFIVKDDILLSDPNVNDVQLEYRFRYENNVDLHLELNKILSDLRVQKTPTSEQSFYKIISFERVQNMRVLKLQIEDKKNLAKLQAMNGQVKHFRGMNIRLRVKPVFVHNYEGPLETKQVIQDILNEKQIKGVYSMDIDMENQKLHVRVESNSQANHDELCQELTKAFEYRKIGAGTIKLKEQDLDINILFTQSGIRYLKQIQEDLQIIIKQDFFNNQLLINSSDDNYKELEKRIIDFTKDTCKCVINIPRAAIKMVMGIDSQGLTGIKNQFELKSVKFNSISGELTLYGDKRNIDTASMSISEMIAQQNLNKTVNSLNCNYCFDTMKNGYMLQGCGHKFCLQCIMFSVQNSLGDVNQLPIRCPQCNSPLLLADMHILLEDESWQKLIKLSINRFCQDNAVDLGFCLTPNCPMIYFHKVPRYCCKECGKVYCNTCKAQYHYGQTCREYKAGSVDSINIYMKKYDVRRCPHCKVLIQRIDGCYRVTCSGCKKSICWKNKADGVPCMLIFETASDCYAHLTKEHGGYW